MFFQRLTLIFTISGVLAMNNIAQEKNQILNYDKMVLEYSDGSGNFYKITKDSISFDPVISSMSSSGLYDGGDASNKRITPEMFDKLYQLFQSIFDNKEIQIGNRMKTSALLKIKEDGIENKKVIIKNYEVQKNIEQLLKKMLK